MQTRLQHVPLAGITVSETNQMFRDESELTAEALQELIDSIKEKGVIQPVLLRPSGSTYQLICGERRFRASKILGLETIPANIREMTDEEAFECQVTENLQRKDVHPLKEARAYQYLVDKNPSMYTPEELAVRFGKTVHYVTIRLKLNELIPEVKKDFMAGKMSLAAALVIARLKPEDQREVKKHCISYGSNGEYQAVSMIEDYIKRNIICNLSSAPFKKDDATLISDRGPCTTCSFRSGANQLFADLKEKDRCFNRTCFNEKRQKHLLNVLRTTIEEKPDIVLLQAYYGVEKPNTEVQAIISEHKLKPLKEYTDFSFSSYNKKDIKVRGLWIDGDKVGQFDKVYIEKKKSAKLSETVKNGSEETSLKLDIERIQERVDRARELDDDKIYLRIVEALREHPTQKNISTALNTAEKAFLSYLLVDLSDELVYDESIWKTLKLGGEVDRYETDQKTISRLYERLASLTIEEQTFLLRRIMLAKYCRDKYLSSKSMPAYFIRKVAESYGDIPVSTYESEQNEIRIKREENASKRIEALKAKVGQEKKPKSKKASKSEHGGYSSITATITRENRKKKKVAEV